MFGTLYVISYSDKYYKMMKQLHYAWKTLMHNKGMALTKIISLGLGLTMCILLFARIDFENSYDTCFKEHQNIYQLWMQWKLGGELNDPQMMCVGSLAGAVMEGLPDIVESAVTLQPGGMIGKPLKYGESYYDEPKILADSLFFSTLGIEVLSGKPVEDLAQPGTVFLSESLAKKIFGENDPLGQQITYNGTWFLHVRGIYRDIPDNASIRPQAVISLPTVLLRGIGNHSWDGGDSWYEYIRLKDKDVDIDLLNKNINKIIQQHAPDTDDVGLYAFVRPTTDAHAEMNEDVRRINTIMWVLAITLLFIASLNYSLISISSLNRRAKAIGVHKCSGAGSGSIFTMFLLETLFILIGAAAVMALLILNFSDFIEYSLSTPISSLFAAGRLWIPVAVISGVLILGGILPGHIFASVPVSQVFRRVTERKRSWKRALLFIEFSGVAFICSLLCVMFAQYRYVVSKDKGYDLTRLATGPLPSVYDSSNAVLAVYRGLPYVEKFSSSIYTPLTGYSGEIVYKEDHGTNFSTRYDYGNKEYLDIMGMTILQGRAPEKTDEVIANQTFIRYMGWDEKTVLTENPTIIAYDQRVRITGILKDFTINGFFSEQQPFIMYYHPYPLKGQMVMKLKEPFEENLNRLNEDMAEAFPAGHIEFKSMERMNEELYKDVKVFRDMTLLAAIAVIMITVMGLVGFVKDEINRRSKEIAIRKVNGAETADILRLMSGDILKVALPAVAIGTAIAAWAGDIWLNIFTVRVDNLWIYYTLTAMTILIIILASVALLSWQTARENPSKSLKSE